MEGSLIGITGLQHVYPSLFLSFPNIKIRSQGAKKKMPQSFSRLPKTFLFSLKGEDLIEQCAENIVNIWISWE
ncbi:hypothetical protein VNO80_16433 [Phaseolus coccineus]|uniref:Uncharacterized protein n=1 Tax=Phaseolus coccineus TaxID=3886 RepID=A0AAN9MLQ5_PHACN